MTATLVLGGPRSGKSRHAEALLAHHPKVTVITTRPPASSEKDSDLASRVVRQQERLPDGWRALQTLDLTRALLSSRDPVLIDDLSGWLEGVLEEGSVATEPQRARDLVEGRLDELSVALRGMPFDVVTVSHEPSWGWFPEDPAERLYVELLAHINQRVSASSSHVHAIMGGRVLDLSAAPLLGTV